MIVFEVFLNGRRVARAGAKDLGVLTTSVAAVGRLGPLAKGMPSDSELHLSVGGLTSRGKGEDEHVNWISVAKVEVGDEVRIRVSDAQRAEKPKSKKKANAQPRPASDKKRFEWAKAVYMKLRSKYERRSPTKRSNRSRVKRAPV